MSSINYAAWRIHNPRADHKKYLKDIANTWKVFHKAFCVEDYPIEEQREMFTEWLLHNLREPSFIIRN